MPTGSWAIAPHATLRWVRADLRARRVQAILLVTHDARVASMADRVINLFDGMVADDARIVPIPRSVNGVRDVLELRG